MLDSANWFRSQILRQHCRNARCGAKLAAPAPPRDAFCCSGCEEQFYQRHCKVCGQLYSPKATGKRRQVCWRNTCRYQFKTYPEQYALRCSGPKFAHNASKSELSYLTSQNNLFAQNSVGSAHFTGLKGDAETGRGWRIIAGPTDLDPVNLLVDPADPKLAAANAANARFWRQAKEAAERNAIFKRDTPPLNLVGGFEWPNAPAVDLVLRSQTTPRACAVPPIGDGLEIPDFLKPFRDIEEQGR
jgi:hypothetical protein